MIKTSTYTGLAPHVSCVTMECNHFEKQTSAVAIRCAVVAFVTMCTNFWSHTGSTTALDDVTVKVLNVTFIPITCAQLCFSMAHSCNSKRSGPTHKILIIIAYAQFMQMSLINAPDLEVTKLELILKLKIKRNDWLLADTCPQAANHCALF